MAKTLIEENSELLLQTRNKPSMLDTSRLAQRLAVTTERLKIALGEIQLLRPGRAADLNEGLFKGKPEKK